jgi:hypothetical protein
MTRVTDWLHDLLAAEQDDLHRTIDPAMTEVDLHRRLAIVRGHQRILERHANCGAGGRCDDGGHGWEDGYTAGGPGCAEIQTLADMYADRPGHNPTWNF